MAFEKGSISAPELLYYLQRLESVISPDADEEDYFRNHSSFREFLRSTLEDEKKMSSGLKEFVCERCGALFMAPHELVDEQVKYSAVCDKCLPGSFCLTLDNLIKRIRP